MKEYLAEKDHSAIYLSKTEQIEKFVANGFDIYEVEGDRRIHIAGPDQAPAKEITIEKRETTGGWNHAERKKESE